MKVIEHFKKATKTHFSYEILPPLKGHSIDLIYKTIDNLKEFEPLNINVTYHQEEVDYKKLPNGLLKKISIRKRPGTVAISAAIKYRYPDVHVVPHLICGGFSKDDTEYALIDLHFLGMKDILVLRGDPLKSHKYFQPEPDGHSCARDLVKQIQNLNNGVYLDENLKNKIATDFSVGVAGYPEKHMEAPSIESDIRYLKEKVDSGADYIVTQMFFENKYFFQFVDRCRSAGITVPIIPGLKPVVTKKDITVLPKTFGISIPDELVKEVGNCKDNMEAFHVGIEWSIRQSRELIKFKVPSIHFFTIGISDNVKAIAREIF